MMRVDDVVADLEGDALGLALDVQVLDLLGRFGDDALLDQGASGCRTSDELVVMSAGSDRRD
jgi:hypothetical protein